MFGNFFSSIPAPAAGNPPIFFLAGMGLVAHVGARFLESAGHARMAPWLELAAYVVVMGTAVSYALDVGLEMVRAVMNYHL